MRAKVVMVARVKRSKGSFPFVPVEIKNDRPVPPKGATSYYARYSGVRKDGSRGRIVLPLGDNLETAYIAFLNVETAHKSQRAGVAPPIPIRVDAPTDDTSLANAIDEYLAEAEAIGNDADTLGSKERVLHSFQAVAVANGVVTIEAMKDVKKARKALLAYLSWMQDELQTKAIDGARRENTFYTRMRRLGHFLRQHGIKIKKSYGAGPDDTGVLRQEEFPKYKGRAPKKYSKTTIRQLLAEADVDEADLIQFLLFTGFRDEEAAHAEWSDINFTDHSINVYSKPRTAARPWSWSPKDDESREESIPLSKEFVARMKARRDRIKSEHCALIFPSGVCKPDNHLLRRVRDVAKRAGVEQTIGLHLFRKTFGSMVAQRFGIETARKYLGHSKISTTQGYLAADSDDAQTVKAAIGNLQAEYLPAK
jgi:integrase